MSILSHHDEFDNYYPLTKNNQGSNQGDLISRSELRKKYQAILDRGDMFCEYDIIGMVDNAPTVEPQKIVTIPPELIEKLASCVVDIVGNIDWDKAIEAYKERPHGEWIITGEEQGALEITYKIRKCNKCGWEIDKEVENEQKTADTSL